jgi:hypothetical protein
METQLTDSRIFEQRLVCKACGKPAQRGDVPTAEECSCYGELVPEDCRRFLDGADRVPDIHLRRIPGAEDQVGGALVDIPQRFVYHSPTGFEWGYGGSGPSDLALNVLGLFLPPSEAWRLHHDYKRDVIARMPHEGGTIEAADVRAWIALQWCKEPV